MSRVWKRFLLKVGKGVATISYVLGIIVGGGFTSLWLGYPFELGTMISLGLFIVLPMLGYMLRETYRDAKQEVEWENRKMMSALKGDKYDF